MAGWIKLHRQIIDSDIYQMPPLYLRVFERLIIEANHQDNEIPYRAKGQDVIGKKIIKRGERLTSVRDVCRWVAWYERGKEVIPNPKTVQNILDWLVENNMIEIYGIKGNRTETHYNIVNYNDFQSQDNEEVTEKKQSLDTNKNDKELNNISIYSIFDNYSENENVRQALRDYSLMRNKIKAPLTERAASMLLNKLDALASTDDTKLKIIEQAILSNWKSVYPLKEDAKQQTQQTKSKPTVIKPNKFHNFDSKIASLGENKLEEIARKNRERFKEEGG